MKKSCAVEFYVKVGFWILFCAFVASIVIPAKINLKTSGNESDVAQTIQVIRTSQSLYAQKHLGRFALNFDVLVKAGYLDKKIFNGQKPVVNGYIFEMKVLEPTNQKPAFYSINVEPLISQGFYKTGTRHYYFDSTLGTVKVTEENRQANADDASF